MIEDDLKAAADSLAPTETQATFKPAEVKFKKKKSRKPLIYSLVIISVVALLGLVTFKILTHKKSTGTSTSVTQVKTVATPTADSDIKAEELTETFTSKILSVSFMYPKSWKVSESANGIKVESPVFNYMPAEAASLDGNFRIFIRQGARDVDSKYIGSGIAIKPSDKLTYTQPAVGQRTDTWLSSFGYNSKDIFSYFLIAGNFQLAQGDTLGPTYGKEPDTYLVVGGYSGSTNADDMSMNSVSLDYYTTTNAYKEALKIIASLQLN